MKGLIQWIIKRFKYANKLDIVKNILDGIDDEDIRKIYNTIDGRINPIIQSNGPYAYSVTSVTDMISNSMVIIVQDNQIIGFGEFRIVYNNGWRMFVIIDGKEQEIIEDEHTRIYILK